MSNYSLRGIDTHLLQYREFKDTCVEAGIPLDEILPLWQTYHLNLINHDLLSFDQAPMDVSVNAGSLERSAADISYTMVNIERTLDHLISVIESR